jgi:hypothetical protein
MRQKLKYVDAEVYAYKGAKSPHYSFFTASDSNVENIEFICEAMRLNNINCEPIKISLN